MRQCRNFFAKGRHERGQNIAEKLEDDPEDMAAEPDETGEGSEWSQSALADGFGQ